MVIEALLIYAVRRSAHMHIHVLGKTFIEEKNIQTNQFNFEMLLHVVVCRFWVFFFNLIMQVKYAACDKSDVFKPSKEFDNHLENANVIHTSIK